MGKAPCKTKTKKGEASANTRTDAAGGVDVHADGARLPVLESIDHVIVDLPRNLAALVGGLPHDSLQALEACGLAIEVHLPDHIGDEHLLDVRDIRLCRQLRHLWRTLCLVFGGL